MKHFLTVALSMLLWIGASAQCVPVDCLDELPPSGGLCAAGFATGRVNMPYADAISFHVTNACVPAAEFDPDFAGASVRITQMGGFTFTALPAGLSGVTDQSTYSPPANGCGLVSGTPTEAGVFAATVGILVNVNVWPFSLTCGGLGPLPQDNNPISQARQLVILPDPAFTGLQEVFCLDDTPVLLTPLGTPGGTFSGPGVVGSTFHPALAGPGEHVIRHVVSAQEGAAIAAATDSLDVVVVVNTCAEPCEADAGTLGGVDFVPCIPAGGSAEIFAIPMGDAVVPLGYELVFLLSAGVDQVLVQVGDEPVFDVSAPGFYTIHALVHDPLTLDLDQLVLFETTVTEVAALLVQGGGAICGSVGVSGETYVVELCDDPCPASAGTLTGPDSIPCLEAGEELLLVAEPAGDAVVPPDFEVLYVLTRGSELLVQAVNVEPSFMVDEAILYTIHTLVYDFATLDIGLVIPFVTTGSEVASWLVQGGGEICASLDVAGFPFPVEACPACEVSAGGMEGGGVACFEDGAAILEATPAGNAVVPDGFETVHVLCVGPELVIAALSAAPLFTVEALGQYSIHAMVYDPLTFELDLLVPGTTTAFEVLAWIQENGGPLCASIDVEGATFSVEVCTGTMETQARGGLRVFPNPGQGDFTVMHDMPALRLLELLDMQGRVVHVQRLQEGAGLFRMHVQGIAAGTYLLRLSGDGGSLEQRVVVGH